MAAVPLVVLLLALSVATQILAGFDSRPTPWQLSWLSAATLAAGAAACASEVKKTLKFTELRLKSGTFQQFQGRRAGQIPHFRGVVDLERHLESSWS